MFDSQQYTPVEIIGKLPVGAIVDSQWMNRHGISHSLRSHYVQSGVLANLRRGLYKKRSPENKDTLTLSWMSVVTSMAQFMDLDFHIGGITALDLTEILYSIIPAEEQVIYLYGVKFPSWLSEVNTDRPIILRQRGLFGGEDIGLRAVPIRSFEKTTKTVCPVSSKERAILEFIDEACSRTEFDSLNATFRQRQAMRSSMLQMLLEKCRSSTVSKIILELGDKYRCHWMHGIDREKISV